MSEISGVLLKDIWNGMTASQHIKCIQSIARPIKQLCAIRLACYESIYHTSESIEGATCINERYVICAQTPTRKKVAEYPPRKKVAPEYWCWKM